VEWAEVFGLFFSFASPGITYYAIQSKINVVLRAFLMLNGCKHPPNNPIQKAHSRG